MEGNNLPTLGRSGFSHPAVSAHHRLQSVSITESHYPTLLKQLHNPPKLLYYKGSLEIFSRPCLAVVGTRKPTPYGTQAAATLLSELKDTGIGIVSGLALGIDALAHELVLEHGGLTAAVLGCGLDIIYPSANRRLAANILTEGGCLISEFAPGTPAFRTNFPRRNRLIAGLSLGTLVIEASEKSGSLITARHALHDNREVMAVPGSIYSPASAGSNELIKSGAHVVTSAEDILNVLKIEYQQPIKTPASPALLSGDEADILDHLSHEPRHIDEIARALRLDMKTINSRLVYMELNGLVRNTGNLKYIRLR